MCSASLLASASFLAPWFAGYALINVLWINWRGILKCMRIFRIAKNRTLHLRLEHHRQKFLVVCKFWEINVHNYNNFHSQAKKTYVCEWRHPGLCPWHGMRLWAFEGRRRVARSRRSWCGLLEIKGKKFQFDTKGPNLFPNQPEWLRSNFRTSIV
jgi:hypothetical protein